MPTARLRPLVLLLTGLLGLAGLTGLTGCGSTVQEGTVLTVYVSAPTSPRAAEDGRAVVAGAEQALTDAGGEAGGAPVELRPLDAADGPGWTQASVAANARAATQDSTSIAYIGDYGSRPTRISAPITNEADLLQVAPAQLSRSLLAEPGGNDVPEEVQTTGERTLGTVLPTEDFTLSVYYGGPPSSLPMYEWGYESMAVVLDAIDRADDPLSRADVISAFLATEDRDGRLGTYSIGTEGAAVYSGPFNPAGSS